VWCCMLRMSRSRPGASPASRRGHPWAVGALACLLLLALMAGRLDAFRMSSTVAEHPAVVSAAAGDDPVTDQFLQRFRSLREDTARRHALAAEITSAATDQELDPDLLLALIAVESRFKSRAVSRKGARGLGQLMFPTARAVAPGLVRHPADLYNIRRNLAITARHLHELLTEQRGDLRAALAGYHLGRHARHKRSREENQYVALICTHYALLKVKRGYEAMAAATHENARSAESREPGA
jgi:soluble lytic murein transglycosylase-like protein